MHSFEQVTSGGSANVITNSVGQDTTDIKTDRVIVYASLSDHARIRHVSGPYRIYLILLTCFQIILVGALTYNHIDVTSLVVNDQRTLKDCMILLFGSLASLLALRRSQPFPFFLVSLANSAGTMIVMYDGFFRATESWLVTCRILSVCIAIFQWYINDLLYEIHSPQIFMLKRDD